MPNNTIETSKPTKFENGNFSTENTLEMGSPRVNAAFTEGARNTASNALSGTELGGTSLDAVEAHKLDPVNLMELATHEDVEVRASLAENITPEQARACPEAVEALARDNSSVDISRPSQTINRTLSKNIYSKPEIALAAPHAVEILASDPNTHFFLAEAIKANPQIAHLAPKAIELISSTIHCRGIITELIIQDHQIANRSPEVLTSLLDNSSFLEKFSNNMSHNLATEFPSIITAIIENGDPELIKNMFRSEHIHQILRDNPDIFYAISEVNNRSWSDDAGSDMARFEIPLADGSSITVSDLKEIYQCKANNPVFQDRYDELMALEDEAFSREERDQLDGENSQVGEEVGPVIPTTNPLTP